MRKKQAQVEAPPQTVLPFDAPDTLGNYAGFATRAVAFVLDLALVATVNITFLMVTGFVSDVLNFGDWSNNVLALITALFGIAWSVGYFAVSWTLTGQTLGMSLLGVRVISTNGSFITLGHAVIRYFCLYISAILLLGYFWVLIDDRRQAFHDKLAGTFVVYSWPAPKAESKVTYRQRGDFLRARLQRADQVAASGPINSAATTQMQPGQVKTTQVRS